MSATFLLIICIIILDQGVKWWVVTNIPLNSGQDLIIGFISLFHLHNRGAGWGLLEGQLLIFHIVSLIMILYLLYLLYINRNAEKIVKLCLSLLLSGTIGNYIDRIRLGYVVDMFRLDFIDFPIFNVADMALTFGVIGLFLFILQNKHVKGLL